jgi:hypothetical protein
MIPAEALITRAQINRKMRRGTGANLYMLEDEMNGSMGGTFGDLSSNIF